ncbi:hypothetical protein SprV_1002916700 [Sparganum proliferum]
MVCQLNDNMMARITDNGAVSEEFAVTNGVKHGCVLAPTLFSLMFPSMLMDAERDERPGIHLAYGTTGHLLNLRRMHFRSRVSTVPIHELLFSDKHLGIHIATRNYAKFTVIKDQNRNSTLVLLPRRSPPASTPPHSRLPSRQTGKVSPLTLAAGSVRPLLDNTGCTRPERRTALVARELARYKVDIAALSETRFSEQCQL